MKTFVVYISDRYANIGGHNHRVLCQHHHFKIDAEDADEAGKKAEAYCHTGGDITVMTLEHYLKERLPHISTLKRIRKPPEDVIDPTRRKVTLREFGIHNCPISVTDAAEFIQAKVDEDVTLEFSGVEVTTYNGEHPDRTGERWRMNSNKKSDYSGYYILGDA